MRLHALLPFALVAPALSGCFFIDNGGGPGSGSSGGDPTQADIKQYDDLKAELEQHRSVFLKSGATELTGIGARLYWLEFPTFDPTLHSFDTTSGAQTNYGFSIGSGDIYNFRPSEELIVTAEPQGADILYHAYAIDGSGELGSFSLPAPSDEQRWWAYAPDHGDVYVVTTGAETKLLRWNVGLDVPEEVLTFEKLGIPVGEFWDFGVDSGKLVMIESGRGWYVDLATQTGRALGNKTEADAGWLDDRGVLLETADGPFFFDYASGRLTNVGRAIADSSFSLNKTFASAHLYDGSDSPSLARLGDDVGYEASSGIFDFDMASGEVRPMLLDARDNSVVYRYPVFLDDGSVFVHGLVSTDGAIGADGPVYRVDFAF
jgi:hypothetical protein